MIHICVPSYNNAKTVGLLLWKIRQVFGDFPREYHLLVANDGSDDATEEVLESYAQVLPMSVLDCRTPRGYAAMVEDLLRQALRLSDRPKRDCAIFLGADFSVSPNVIPNLIRRIESGADVVLAEATERRQPLGRRMVQRAEGWLLRPGLHLPGARDLLSGAYAIRLVTLKRCLRDHEGSLLKCDGICARAELVARAASHARQITTFTIDAHDLRPPAAPEPALSLAMQLFRAGRQLRIPQPAVAVQRVP